MSWTKNLLLVLISTVFSLVLAEFASRVIAPQDLSSSWGVKDRNGLTLNKSSGSAIQRHHGREALYHFATPGLRIFPSLPRQTTDESESVLVVGDSFTFGWLLDDEDTYVYQLAAHYSDIVFYNAAVGGWGAADYLLYIREYCRSLTPNAVLVIMNADDIGRLIASNHFSYDVASKDARRNDYVRSSKDRLKSFLNALPFYNWMLNNSNLVQLVRSAYLSAGREDDAQAKGNEIRFFGIHESNLSSEEIYEYSYSIFGLISQEISNCGSVAKLVYTGIVDETTRENPTITFLEMAKDRESFAKLGFDFVDLTHSREMKLFREETARFIIPFDGHPNEDGAKLLFNAIKSSEILN